MPYLDDLVAAYGEKIRERPQLCVHDARAMFAQAPTASERGSALAALAWGVVRVLDTSGTFLSADPPVRMHGQGHPDYGASV